MSVWGKVSSLINEELDRRLSSYQSEPLEKSLKSDGYGRKGLMFDPFSDQGTGGLFKPKGAGSSFVGNHVLKLVSRRDPIVSTILHVRATQSTAFCRRQFNRFDTGFKVISRDKTKTPDLAEILEIEEFILNCGKTENRAKEDELSFDQWAYMVTWDMLVYGHAAIEKIRQGDGSLCAFLPLPAESIYYANKKQIDKDVIKTSINTFKEAYETYGDGERPKEDPNPNEDYFFVQVINGKVVEGFTQDELTLARIYLQSEVDLQGYAFGPLERCISMITAHLQIENHQKMFFTHGVASKGLLVIQGDVTPNQLRTLQAQWTNQVTGPAAAWRTPILSGIKGVQWQPLTMGSRDMEYAAYQDHILRSIHASFSIDPEETGFGYLSKGTEQRSLSESSNEWKITSSRDRGLRPLLNRIEQIINMDILPAWRKDYADKYEFCFVGLDAESRTEEISRLQSEVQLHTTLDEAREQADLDPLPVGGGLILNALLLQTLQANMSKGMFMEKFMNIPGASQRPDLQYIPDAYWFQWQQMQQQMFQQQAQAQATMQSEPPEDQKAPSSDPDKRKQEQTDQANDAAQEEHESKQAQAQAQQIAVDQFIQANPELFKSMKETLAKAEVPTVDLEAIEKMQEGLIKDFERGANFLIKEVLEAVSDDLKEKAGKPKPAPKE